MEYREAFHPARTLLEDYEKSLKQSHELLRKMQDEIGAYLKHEADHMARFQKLVEELNR